MRWVEIGERLWLVFCCAAGSWLVVVSGLVSSLTVVVVAWHAVGDSSLWMAAWQRLIQWRQWRHRGERVTSDEVDEVGPRVRRVMASQNECETATHLQ